MSGARWSETAAGAQRPISLRSNKGFRLLWIGQLLSDTGTQVGGLAYPLLILALTHSAVLAGTVGTVRAITIICLQLPAGALSDRFDRRLTMIICDIMRAVLLAVLTVLIVTHLASWPVVMTVSVIEGGANAIFTPTVAAALPEIVPIRNSRRHGQLPRPGVMAPAWPARRSAGCCTGEARPSRSSPTRSPTSPRSAR